MPMQTGGAVLVRVSEFARDANAAEPAQAVYGAADRCDLHADGEDAGIRLTAVRRPASRGETEMLRPGSME
jgi:hypothetical protein